jgi:hypothetical protein
MNTSDVYAKALDCSCAHPMVTHVLSEKAPRRRTWCSVGTAKDGQCTCTKYAPKEASVRG